MNSVEQRCDGNDLCYFSPDNGVLSVPQRRWKEAQRAEERHWAHASDHEDGWKHHARGFASYTAVNRERTRTWIEIGCGPFTQTAYILQLRQDIVPYLKDLTLSDPNIENYKKNVPACGYRSGKLGGIPVETIAAPNEKLIRVRRTFDTLVVINVAEHVQDIFLHFEAIYALLKPGGQLIFSDRAWDNYDPVTHAQNAPLDVLFHPTRAKSPIFRHFLSLFETSYCVTTTTPDALSPKAFYFIGYKRSSDSAKDMNYNCTDISWADLGKQPGVSDKAAEAQL